MSAGEETRRRVLSELDELARGVQPVNLNQGQNFDAVVERAASLLLAEIGLELDAGIPVVRRRLGEVGAHEVFRSARFVRHHARTHPNPRPRWHERIAPLARLHAVYDLVRGLPTRGLRPMQELDELDLPSGRTRPR